MKLLKKLYQISSPSGGEKLMTKYIEDYCKSLKVKFTKDKTGNIYITKGESDIYPCVVAHLDEVHHSKPKSFKIVEEKGILLGLDTEKMELVGIGADDKNGIWVALKCLELYDHIKLSFFVQEEVGCVGSRNADMSFFDNCSMVIQCDRRNGSDFITSIGSTDLCDKNFYKRCEASKFGYKVTSGLSTDVATLKNNGLKVCAVNLSCGYYNPHSRDEMTKFSELVNCLNLVKHMIDTLGSVIQKHVPNNNLKGMMGGSCSRRNVNDDWDNWLGYTANSEWYKRKQTIAKIDNFLIGQDVINLSSGGFDMADIIIYLKDKYQGNLTGAEIERMITDIY